MIAISMMATGWLKSSVPYSTAANRYGRLLDHLGIDGVHTHSLRHQFASEALDANPRELANISQVLGHDSVETTLRFYIHPSANHACDRGAVRLDLGASRSQAYQP